VAETPAVAHLKVTGTLLRLLSEIRKVAASPSSTVTVSTRSTGGRSWSRMVPTPVFLVTTALLLPPDRTSFRYSVPS
jgi:hypothetical protein